MPAGTQGSKTISAITGSETILVLDAYTYQDSTNGYKGGLSGNPLAGQDSELMPPPAASMARGALQDAPLKVYTLPSQSPAAQNILDAQETDWSEDPVLSTWAGDQDVPLYVSASPPPLTATQNVLDGQDTEVRPVSVIGFGTVQDWPFQRIARPRVSTATQNAGLAQDTLLSSTLSPPGSMEAGADQEVPFHRRALLPD